MKRYKPLLFQIGVLFFVLAVVLFIFEQRKQFVSVDFTKHYAQNRTIEIAGFEDGEGWQGNYSYDTKRVLEGKTSITLSSWYGKENSIQNTKEISIPPGYTNGYVSVYVKDTQILSSLVSLSLELIGEKKEGKVFPIGTELKPGWNRIAVSIPNWKKLTKVSFVILSKETAIAEINLDRFWIENSTLYTTQIFSPINNNLSLRTIGERTYLFSASPDVNVYTLNNPPSIKRGSVTISFIPEHAQEVSLSLNSTSIRLDGPNMNRCSLYKESMESISKTMQSTSGKDDLYLFVRAAFKNGKITYSLSNNGVDYEECGSVLSGAKKMIQLSLHGSYLIDSYTAEY